jgi:hypothetical protein
MTDRTLNALRRKLQQWELAHLRQHCTELAERLERAEARAYDAEYWAEYWRENAFQLQRDLMDDGVQIGITQDGAELGYAPGKTFANGLWGTANLDVARESLHLLTWEGVQRISNNVQGNDGQIPVSQYDLLAQLSSEFGMDIIDLHHRLGQQTNKLGRVPTFEEFRAWLRTLPRRNSPRYSDLQNILDSARAGGTGALGEDAAWSIIQDWIDNPFINDRSLPTNGYNGVQGFQPWDGAGLGGGGVSVPGWAIEAMDPRSGIRFPGMINGGNPSGDGFVQYVVTNSFEFHFDGYLGDKDELADAITEVLDKKFAA